MSHGVAMGAERGARRVDLLYPALPESAAVVDHLILLELVDPQAEPMRMALGREATRLERAEDGVGAGLEHGRLAEGALGNGALVVGARRTKRPKAAEGVGQPERFGVGPRRGDAAGAEPLVA